MNRSARAVALALAAAVSGVAAPAIMTPAAAIPAATTPAAATPAAALAPAPAAKRASAISGHDGNAPVNFSADRMEVQDRADRVLLSGDVDVTQAELRLRASRVTVSYTNTDASGMQVQRMIAAGGVLVTRPGQTARGDAAVYDLNQRVITLVGNVALTRLGDTLNGGRLVIDLDTGRYSLDGRSGGGAVPGAAKTTGGRVSGQFSTPKRQQ